MEEEEEEAIQELPNDELLDDLLEMMLSVVVVGVMFVDGEDGDGGDGVQSPPW